MDTDWTKVVEMNPRGYVELNNGERVIHGPVESVSVTDGMVEIKAKWAAQVALDDIGLPEGDWKALSSVPVVVASFPNEMLPFEIEDTPRKGDRVRFGTMNIIYLDEIKGINPALVKGLQL